jgi:hypothetical protein
MTERTHFGERWVVGITGLDRHSNKCLQKESIWKVQDIFTANKGKNTVKLELYGLPFLITSSYIFYIFKFYPFFSTQSIPTFHPSSMKSLSAYSSRHWFQFYETPTGPMQHGATEDVMVHCQMWLTALYYFTLISVSSGFMTKVSKFPTVVDTSYTYPV